MSWPSSTDPWYLANPVDNDARRSYYGVTGTPTMKCDGTTCGTTQSSITAVINNRLLVSSPLRIELEMTVLGDQLNATASVYSEQTISGNYVIHFALLERYVYLPSPNGQPNHYGALLKMAPNAGGQLFSATASQTSEYDATITLDPSWELANLDLAVFVQNNITKEILQGFKDTIPLDFPNVMVTDYSVSDPTGNGDGRVDPGETGEFIVTLENQIPFHDATDVVATLSTEDPLIDVTYPSVNFPDLASGASAANDSDPFEFYVDPAFAAHEVTFNVEVTAEPGSFQASYQMTFMVGRPDIVIINDDPNSAYTSFYESSLDELDLVYDSYDQWLLGTISQDEIELYEIAIWFTGDDDFSTFDLTDQARIENYLANGGRLFLSSQNAGDVLWNSPFYNDVLHAEHLDNSLIAYMVSGVEGDPISNGTSMFLGGAGGAGNSNSTSSMIVLEPAVGIYTYDGQGTSAGLRCETENSRFVYFPLAFEAVSTTTFTNSRSEILQLCLDWITSPVAVEPQEVSPAIPADLALAGIYPNPFNPTTDLLFDIPAAGLVLLEVYDLQGKLVERLMGKTLEPGQYKLTWNASQHSSGVYVVQLRSNGISATTKAVLLK
ncbi:MAG: Omp28-related outer membrane protein [bacterium]